MSMADERNTGAAGISGRERMAATACTRNSPPSFVSSQLPDTPPSTKSPPLEDAYTSDSCHFAISERAVVVVIFCGEFLTSEPVKREEKKEGTDRKPNSRMAGDGAVKYLRRMQDELVSELWEAGYVGTLGYEEGGVSERTKWERMCVQQTKTHHRISSKIQRATDTRPSRTSCLQEEGGHVYSVGGICHVRLGSLKIKWVTKLRRCGERNGMMTMLPCRLSSLTRPHNPTRVVVDSEVHPTTTTATTTILISFI